MSSPESPPAPPPADVVTEADLPQRSLWTEMRTTEDWWAIWIAAILLTVVALSVRVTTPAEAGGKYTAKTLFRSWVAKPETWETNPADSLKLQSSQSFLIPMLVVMAASGALFGIGNFVMGRPVIPFLVGFVPLYALAALSLVLAEQTKIKYYGLEYALWALVFGLVISNVFRTPAWLKPALQTEFYIKTGLVLYGAKVLLTVLTALGIPGLCVAWIVTPIVLITTFWFGQKILKIESPELNIVVSADMSVCGVSAAIATAAACRAKKEELSLAIGLSLAFTVIMMIVQPYIIKGLGIDEVVGGAWLGGTIDSTGAVAAAGNLVSERAGEVAITVKMIQNLLIGVLAFGVATYWITYIEKGKTGRKADIREIWYRFPKFVLGFLAASVVFTWLNSRPEGGPALVKATQGVTEIFRDWFFCLAFVSIGLESDFRELVRYMHRGKPLILYVSGQTLSLFLSLGMSYLMFGIIFKDWVTQAVKP